MRRFDSANRNNGRPDGVAEAFQVIVDIVEHHVSDVRRVLNQNVGWSGLRNNPSHFRPERTVICVAKLFPGNTVWLAREPAGNKVNCSELVSVERLDVVMLRHSWPMLVEHTSAPRVNLAEANGLVTEPVDCKRKTANAREQIKVPNHAVSPRRSACTFVMRSELALVLQAFDPQVF